MDCCDLLKENLEDKRVQIYYEKKFREYYIWGNLERTAYQTFQYCPFCGEKLPKELRSEWFDILEDDYRLEDPLEDDREKVPVKFNTDKWWIERKL